VLDMVGTFCYQWSLTPGGIRCQAGRLMVPHNDPQASVSLGSWYRRFGSTQLLFSAMNGLVSENILGQDSGASRAAKDTLRHLGFWLLFCCISLGVASSRFVTVLVVYPARFILS